jgi:hypothetical protein
MTRKSHAAEIILLMSLGAFARALDMDTDNIDQDANRDANITGLLLRAWLRALAIGVRVRIGIGVGVGMRIFLTIIEAMAGTIFLIMIHDKITIDCGVYSRVPIY